MKKIFGIPYVKIFLSFLAVVLLGAFLLSLPISSSNGEGIAFVDALFTSASSVCLTGLGVFANCGAQFSVFGKVVIAVLIEIGGLSVLTLAIFAFVLFGKKVGIKDRFLMKEALNQNTSSGIVRLILTIVTYTLVIQAVGMVLLFISLIRYYSLVDAIFISIFHSIASFNNAGIEIFGFEGGISHLAPNAFFSITTMILIALGGLGFMVLKDIFTKKPRDYMLLTKIVIPMTAIIIISGMLLLKLALRENATWLEALFQAISGRTAGFSVLDIEGAGGAETMTYLLLMLVGGSPCSTGGGMKTTTIFVILITVICYSCGKEPQAFRRKIPKRAIFKAFSLVALFMGFLALNILLLAFLEPNQELIKLIFEAVSALSNAGLSIGITSSLSSASKILLSFSMFIGRLGPLTLLNMLNRNWIRETKSDIQYVEESVLIG